VTVLLHSPSRPGWTFPGFTAGSEGSNIMILYKIIIIVTSKGEILAIFITDKYKFVAVSAPSGFDVECFSLVIFWIGHNPT
jgi:hypothetical protein